jgi:hypothetical protein
MATEDEIKMLPPPLQQRVQGQIMRLAIALARQAAAEDDQAERQKVRTDARRAVCPL